MICRRDEILAAAQLELQRSHRRRVMHRRVRSSGAALVTVAALTATMMWLIRPTTPSDPMFGAERAHGAGALVLAPGEPSASPDDAATSAQAAAASPEPGEIAATETPTPVRRVRIEIVTSVEPASGFVEVLDDRGLERALSQLPTPMGVAVIGGRTHLVANPFIDASERLR
ncbi:MAG: hypothetical protein KF724_08955 [Phycisphaeraceae bacterium]|nr:hypothetical protein [Phycisphaeraceae bacterium]